MGASRYYSLRGQMSLLVVEALLRIMLVNLARDGFGADSEYAFVFYSCGGWETGSCLPFTISRNTFS